MRHFEMVNFTNITIARGTSTTCTVEYVYKSTVNFTYYTHTHTQHIWHLDYTDMCADADADNVKWVN